VLLPGTMAQLPDRLIVQKKSTNKKAPAKMTILAA
jgi:hypothetical protein